MNKGLGIMRRIVPWPNLMTLISMLISCVMDPLLGALLNSNSAQRDILGNYYSLSSSNKGV